MAESDDEQARKDRALTRTISAAEFGRFLEEKVTNLACFGCGSTEFQIETENDDKTAFPASLPDRLLSAFVPALHTSCLNCGLVRTYSMEQVAKWRGDL